MPATTAPLRAASIFLRILIDTALLGIGIIQLALGPTLPAPVVRSDRQARIEGAQHASRQPDFMGGVNQQRPRRLADRPKRVDRHSHRHVTTPTANKWSTASSSTRLVGGTPGQDVRSFFVVAPGPARAEALPPGSAGGTVFRSVFAGLHRHGLFNGDPHPGNYIFRDDGTVTFLDFGCVKRFPADRVLVTSAVVDAALAGDTSVGPGDSSTSGCSPTTMPKGSTPMGCVAAPPCGRPTSAPSS